VAVIAGLTFAVTATLSTVTAEPLRDELILLLAEHPDIARARNDTAAAQARIGEAEAANLPKFELSADSGAERTDDPTRRAGDLGAFSIRRDKVTLTVTQNLFNGYRDQAGISAAEIGLLAERKGLQNTRQELLFQGIEQYLETLRNVRLIEVARATENNIRTQKILEDDRVKGGSGITVDVLQAKSRLQIAKEQRVGFEGQLLQSKARYKQLFGHLPDTATLEEGLPPKNLIPDTLDKAIQTAIERNPALRAVVYLADVAREQKRIAKADYLPTLELVGVMDYAKNVGTTRGIKREQSLLLKARWEFFSGFLTRSRVENAARTLASRRDTLNFAARRVEEDVRVAWDRLATAQRRLDILKTAVQLADEVFDAKKRLRKAGKVTAPEVLNAENEVFGARIKLINADFDARIAAYLILRQTGMLTPAALQLSDSVASILQNFSTQPVALVISKGSPPKSVMPAAQKSKQPAVAVLSPSPQSATPEPAAAALVPAEPQVKAPRLTQAEKVRGAKNSVTLRSPSFGGADGTIVRDKMTAMSESDRPRKTGKLLATTRPAGLDSGNAATPSVPRKRMQPLPATPVAVALPPHS
jgi:adhesin transport system outer membrane protein